MSETITEKKKRPLSIGARVLLYILLLAVVIACVYIAYYLIRYRGYNKYREYLSEYEYENGNFYSPVSKGNGPEGTDLIGESRYLKLYVNPSNGYVAVEDTRNGSITWSNPVDADEDTIANRANKNYLKSQFLLGYYNADVKTGTFDSFSACVEKKQLSVESIAGGVRFIYNIGDTGTNSSGTENIHFEIPLEYRLYDDYVEVSIPAKGIREYGNGAVYRIQLLRYFGSAGLDEEGYMVVPNGSGSIIYFNNGKTSAAAYSQYIYEDRKSTRLNSSH